MYGAIMTLLFMSKKPHASEHVLVPAELIDRRIYLIRGQKVMLDADLAEVYQVLTKNLNLAVRRNAERFPRDFMFQLTKKEGECLRLQFATSNAGRGGRRYLPNAFTELGVAMLSSVLNSPRAIKMNIIIMRAFVRLREALATHKDLAQKIEQLEGTQKKHASIMVAVVEEIGKLKQPPRQRKTRIGFYSGETKPRATSF
jgi:ORF6N domain